MTTLANAAAVLKWMKTGKRAVGVSEVAAEFDWPKSTVSRLLSEMADCGLLMRHEVSRKYEIGLLPLELGRLHRANVPLFEAADSLLSDITRRTGHTTGLVVLDGIHTVVLRARPGVRPLAVFRPPGHRGTAWTLCTGRCLLARLDDAEIARRFTPFPSPPLPLSMPTFDDLMKRIAIIRQRGWDESINETNPGVGGVAVAVVDPHSGDAVAPYIAFPAIGTSVSERKELTREVQNLAGQLAAQFDDLSSNEIANLQSRRSK